MLTARNLDPVQEMVLETITPAQARQYLDNNTNNRSLSAKTVNRYVDVIKKGEWLVNGESIKFAPDGGLIDGQHRLKAICEANRSIDTYVLYNAPQNIFHTIDNGKIRSGSDILSIYGCENHVPMKAAALRAINVLNQGLSTAALNTYSMRIENSELLELYIKTPDIDEEIDYASKYKRAKQILGYGTFAACFYLFGKVDPTKRDLFFSGLNDGVDLPEGSPIIALRNKIMSIRSTGTRIRTGEMMRITIAAWRSFGSDKKVTFIKGKKEYYLYDIC